jgi:hypothetical protein
MGGARVTGPGRRGSRKNLVIFSGLIWKNRRTHVFFDGPTEKTAKSFYIFGGPKKS